MRVRLLSCDGESYGMPVPLSWRVLRTGSVPCDELEVKCPFNGELMEVLKRCDRFAAYEGAEPVLLGVVDDYAVSLSEKGLFLTVSGRGMMARLLDNEAEAESYQMATLSEMLRRHAGEWGISWQETGDGTRGGAWQVKSGESQWSALSNFCRSALGYEPYMTALGELVIAPLRGSGATLSVDGSSPVLACTLREKRYGVISEMLVKNKSGGSAVRVVNEDFARRGGRRRQVLYMPRKSGSAAMRYTGRYQIEASEKGARQVELTLAGAFLASPGDIVKLSYEPLHLYGNYDVVEAESRGSEGAVTTTLVLEER